MIVMDLDYGFIFEFMKILGASDMFKISLVENNGSLNIGLALDLSCMS